MKEIVRSVPKNSEDRDKKDLLSTSLQVHLFWKFLSKSYRYLPQGQHQAQVLWSVTILFHLCHLCTGTKVIHKTSYLGAQRLFFLRRQYPELQKLLAGYGKRKLFSICITIWLNIIILFKTFGKEKNRTSIGSPLAPAAYTPYWRYNPLFVVTEVTE